MQFVFQRRALVAPALVTSVAIHGVCIAVALSGSEHLAPPQAHAAPPPPQARPVAYVIVVPQPPHLRLAGATRRPATHPSRAPHSPPGTPHSAPAPKPAAPPPPSPAARLGERSQPMAARQPPPESRSSPIQVVYLEPSGPSVGIPSLTSGLGFRVPPGDGQDGTADALGSAGERGTMTVAELITGAGTACPELPLPHGRSTGGATVTVAFVVDAAGDVDPGTLRVVESPERPRTEYRFYSHIYAVAASARDDRDLPDAGVAYDLVVTRDVLRHIRGLVFRPALVRGRPARSTVLVSCQVT